MITYSGIRMEPGSLFDGKYGAGAPAITDIALCLGRVPRFGGNTRQWWTVLQHTIVCVRLASKADHGPLGEERIAPSYRLFTLLHDAHEAVTGDIPAFWKTPDMKLLQDEIDVRIRAGLGIRAPNADEIAFVKQIDLAALRAEAWVVGPPSITRYIGRGERSDERIVRDVLDEFPTPLHTDGFESAGVRKFLSNFNYLMGEAFPESDHTP